MTNNQGHIYYGSLESQERNRMVLENQQQQGIDFDSLSMASLDTQATMRNVNQNQFQGDNSFQQPQNVQSSGNTVQFSQESLLAKAENDEKMRQFELEKKLRHITVTTDDKEVKIRLRQMGHPICYFGEGPAHRRERLKGIMGEILMETGELPKFETEEEQKNTMEEEQELFYYHGPEQLVEIRKKIAKYSIKRAALRIENSKMKRINTDALELEQEVEEHVEQALKFSVTISQFTDNAACSKGTFSPNNDLFATAGGNGECQVWSVPDGNMLSHLNGHLSKVHDIEFHPFSGKGLTQDSCANIATSSSDCNIRLWSNIPGQEFQKSVVLSGHKDRVNKVRFHQLGTHIVSTSHDFTWRFWDLQTQKDLFIQTGHQKPVYALAIQPDGSLIYTGDFSGIGQIWDIRTGKAVLPLMGHVKSILCADFSSNGYTLATGGEDNMIRIWDLRRKACMQPIPAHSKLISDVKFEPNHGKFLLSASYDHDVKVWTSTDWSLAQTFKSHESQITSLSISPSCQYLATTSLDRKWMLWEKKD